MIVVDTDIAIEYLRGNEKVIKFINQSEDVYTTQITLAELFYGLYNGSAATKYWKMLGAFVGGMQILSLDVGSCKLFGKIKSTLKKKGKPIQDFDMLIAAITMTYDGTLVTRNKKHYEKVDGLQILIL